MACVHAESPKSCPALYDPMDNSLPGFSVYRLVRQEYWSRLPFSPLGDIPNQGIKPSSLMFPVLEGRFFTTSATWKALIHILEE